MAKITPASAAARLGLDYAPKGDGALRDSFAHLPELSRRSTIKHVMTGELDGRPLIGFEASYWVFAGQVTVQVAHVVYATEAPQWPVTRISPRNFWGRLRLRLGMSRDLMLDDPEFNRRFRVTTHEEDFTIALLGPEMQQFMLGKKTARWRIGHGRVCLVYSGTLKSARLEASLARLQAFWSHVPPELESW